MQAGEDTTEAVLKIIEASLFVRYLTISPSVLFAHDNILKKRNIEYEFKRNVIKNFLIPSNVTNHNIENIFNGDLPTNILIFFVENDAFNGDITKNPYHFQHFYISQIQFNYNGRNIPNTPLTLTPNSGLVARAYHDLHLGLNVAGKDFGLMFSEIFFRQGYCINALDFTATKRENVVNMNESEILKGEFKFSKPLSSPITMLVYAEFNSSFEINYSKNVIINY